jgi:hypothetical protein
MRRFTAVTVVLVAALGSGSAAAAKVLRVGTYKGIKGQYRSIQAAVNAAKPGDWVLVAPGDYKTISYRIPSGSGGDFPAGVLINKPRLRLRGMNRNTVIVDGTRKGPACNDIKANQNFGPKAKGGNAGLNGVMVWKANNVWVQNLTSCNFLGGAGGDGGTGNEIWWNGGADSGQVGGWGYLGSYLNGTSTWYDSTAANPNSDQSAAEDSAAEYGIFSSNWNGGTWNQTYTSNMNDSGYYIGACQQQCNQTVNHAWAEYNALGYSGSNSGGSLVVENSQFDNNEDGFDTNSQNGDNPPPQNGACPNGKTSPITHTTSCWVFMHNYVHDNNNPNVPAAGAAAAGPVGTGMSISGARNDTVMDNRFVNNNAWGVIFVPYLDSGPPCTGGTMNELGAGSCLYDEWGDALIGNTFTNNGSYGHPSNGNWGQINFENGHPTNCYAGNTDTSGNLGTDETLMQTEHPTCNGQPATTGSSNPAFLGEVLCDTQVELSPGVPSACPSGQYPRMDPKKLVDGLHPLPARKSLPSMPNPCQGVPSNPWCSKPKRK